MFGIIKIKGVEYELTGDPEFEMENGKEVAFVTMFQGEGAVYIAKYRAKDEKIVGGFSNPIDIELVAEEGE